MDRWVIYAIASMVFAGCTSVVAKQGLAGISGEMGLFVRTCFVFAMLLGFSYFAVPRAQFGLLTQSNLCWLGLSGVTTSLSWIFYYKALKIGDVGAIAIIDKGSFVIAVILAAILLGERITWRVALGSCLILAGLLVVIKK